jgi:hypothetical protein
VRPVSASRSATTRRPDCTGSTVPMPCIWTRRLDSTSYQSVALALAVCPVYFVVRRDYPSRGHNDSTSPTPCDRVPRHVVRLVSWLIVDYSASRRTSSTTSPARPGTSARRRLLRLRRASGCLGTSRAASSTTSPTPRVRVPRHVARLVAWLVVDYFTSRRLVVDYFTYAARPGASARRAARRRLLRPHRASGCLGTSRGSSSTTSPAVGSSSTTSPTPRVLVPRHVARLVVDHTLSHRSTSRRSVALAVAERQITPSRGSTTPCAATRLVVWSHRLYFSHVVRRDYLSRGNCRI